MNTVKILDTLKEIDENVRSVREILIAIKVVAEIDEGYVDISRITISPYLTTNITLDLLKKLRSIVEQDSLSNTDEEKRL